VNKQYVYDYYQSPVGNLKLVASQNGLTAVLWRNDNDNELPFSLATEDFQNINIIKAKKQLTDYFAGKRTQFDIKLDLNGTDFQKNVWQQLLKIKFGQTQSYKDIALILKNKNACRAVGAANSKNPVPIIVPCHRVIGSNGTLTGFSGGLNTKSWLLDFEKSILSKD
jgi:methylated-DNA-[protein]-cysteine S-methyltransferase